MESKNLIFVFYSSWKYLTLFIVWDRIFLQVRFEICYYLWGLRRSGDVNLIQPMIYPINISMMLFSWFVYLFCCCWFTFWHFKEVNQKFTKTVILQFYKVVKEIWRWYKKLRKNHWLLRKIRKTKVNIISTTESPLF